MCQRRQLRALIAFFSLFSAFGAAAGAVTLTKQLTIQPVLICEDAVASTCAEPAVDIGLIDAIYAQIGVQTTVQPFLTVTDLDLPRAMTGTTVGPVDGEPANSAFGAYMIEAGLAANTAYIGAVGQTMTLFGSPAQGVAKVADEAFPFGLFVNNSHLTQVESPSEIARFARLNALVVAHEVGHILGGRHYLAPPRGTYTHLLEPRSYYPPEGYVPLISSGNAAIMAGSPLLGEVYVAPDPVDMPQIVDTPEVAHAPLPAPVFMMLGAIGLLVFPRRLPAKPPLARPAA